MGYTGPLKAAIFDLGGVVLDIHVPDIFRSWAESTGLGRPCGIGRGELQ